MVGTSYTLYLSFWRHCKELVKKANVAFRASIPGICEELLSMKDRTSFFIADEVCLYAWNLCSTRNRHLVACQEIRAYHAENLCFRQSINVAA